MVLCAPTRRSSAELEVLWPNRSLPLRLVQNGPPQPPGWKKAKKGTAVFGIEPRTSRPQAYRSSIELHSSYTCSTRGAHICFIRRLPQSAHSVGPACSPSGVFPGRFSRGAHTCLIRGLPWSAQIMGPASASSGVCPGLVHSLGPHLLHQGSALVCSDGGAHICFIRGRQPGVLSSSLKVSQGGPNISPKKFLRLGGGSRQV